MVKWRLTIHVDRPESERRDCIVDAVATAADIPYTEAHAMLKLAGRKDRHGFYIRRFMAGRAMLGAYHVEHIKCRVTLAQFLRDFPQGHFMVRRSGHVFVITDGWVRDSFPQGARCRITDLWHFTRRTQ
jgi:hypothetical protein